MSLISLHLPSTFKLHEDLEVTQGWQAYLVISSWLFAAVKSASHIEPELRRRLGPQQFFSPLGAYVSGCLKRLSFAQKCGALG